jgi:predicted RNase H-like nuclease
VFFYQTSTISLRTAVRSTLGHPFRGSNRSTIVRPGKPPRGSGGTPSGTEAAGSPRTSHAKMPHAGVGGRWLREGLGGRCTRRWWSARAIFGSTITLLVAQVPDAEAIAVDVPIGLPLAGPRAADLAARTAIGLRRSSVFPTPIRAALEAGTYEEANRVSQQATSHGISQQAWRLGPKILEVDAWVSTCPVPVWEIHPEVSFAVLSGHYLDPKTTWAGARERCRLLRTAGIVLDDGGKAGRMVKVDDLLDAAVAAWTGRRLLVKTARSYPDPPEVLSGRPVAIWA